MIKLQKISPVLEKRIKNSSFAGLTKSFCINTYNNNYTLDFKKGKIAMIKQGKGWGDISIATNVAVKLFLGYKSLDELHANYPDLMYDRKNKYLIEVLFPKSHSYICKIM